MPAQSPYPNIAQYKRWVNLERFTVVDEEGIWFTSPVGLTCAIDDYGSYGCTGKLPGVPLGENEIGWFPGDSFPRLYHTDAPRFDSGHEQMILSLQTYIQYHGVTCAVTLEARVYCIHGDDLNSQFMVGNDMTWRGRDAAPTS
jgi:hypothetical protein